MADVTLVIVHFNPCCYVRSIRNFTFTLYALSSACPALDILIMSTRYVGDALRKIKAVHGRAWEDMTRVLELACAGLPNVRLQWVRTHSISFCKEGLQNIAWSACTSRPKLMFMDSDILPMYIHDASGSAVGAARTSYLRFPDPVDRGSGSGGGSGDPPPEPRLPVPLPDIDATVCARVAALSDALYKVECACASRVDDRLIIARADEFIRQTRAIMHERGGAWLHHNVRTWVDLISRTLDTKQVVQPFSHMLSAENNDGSRRSMSISSMFTNEVDFPHSSKRLYGRPGFVWAFQRQTLARMGGLYAVNVTGGSDSVLSRALERRKLWSVMSYMSACAAPYLAQVKSAVRADGITYLPVICMHMFHGTKVARKYDERHTTLQKSGYDPETDLFIPASPPVFVVEEDAMFADGSIIEFKTNVSKYNDALFTYLLSRVEDADCP